ncbi:MAG TPA: glycosyltransferase family 2 protein [Anaerolineales bacterium]
MNSSPLISMVVPSFNQALYLEECLGSVLEQTYPRREIIVIDGGSTDGSREILRRHERRLEFWISEADRGQAHAVIKGWTRAKGDILGWLNSDDRLETGALDFVAGAYVSQPRAAILYGDVREIDARGGTVGGKRMADFGLRSLLLGKNMGQPGVFIPRRTYDALGGLDESLHFALDFEYFLRVWTAFPTGGEYIPQVLASSRVWEAAKTIKQGGHFGEEYRIVLERYFARTDLPPAVRALRRRALARSVYFRQARLYFQGGDARQGVAWLARAAWMEGSPLEAARMIRMAIDVWRQRGFYAI